MKFIVFVLPILISGCLQNPLKDKDSSQAISIIDANDTLNSSDNSDFIDVRVEDVTSDLDVIITPANFPDPDRMNLDPCMNHLDCKRNSACMNDRCGQRSIGCGWFARSPPSRDTGCLLNEYGTGQHATAECKNDSDCPSNMPNCILRMCQVNARCTMDSDCVGEQFCDYDTWCSLRAPCEEDGRCRRGACRPDGFCSYPGD